MKKLVITIIAMFAFALLATSSVYPMEPAQEMGKKEKAIFQPKSLQEMAGDKFINDILFSEHITTQYVKEKIKPYIDQQLAKLSVETFYEIYIDIIRYITNYIIYNIEYNFSYTPEQLKGINERLLITIMGEYIPIPVLNTAHESKINDTISNFLLLVLFKKIYIGIDTDINPYTITDAILYQMRKKVCAEEYNNFSLEGYGEIFLRFYLPDTINIADIDASVKKIEQLQICNQTEKNKYLRRNKSLSFNDNIALIAFQKFDQEFNIFLKRINTTSYLKLASLNNTAEKLRQNYQAMQRSLTFQALQKTEHYRQEYNSKMQEIEKALSKNINVLKYELDAKPWLQKTGQRLKQIGATVKKEALDEAKDIGKACVRGLLNGVAISLAWSGLSLLKNNIIPGLTYKNITYTMIQAALGTGVIRNAYDSITAYKTKNNCLNKECLQNVFGASARLGLLYGGYKLWQYTASSSMQAT